MNFSKFIYIFLIVLLILLVCFAIFDFFSKSEKKVESNIENNIEDTSDEQLKEKIGQMIMVGFDGETVQENSDIYNIIKTAKIGGVILFDYDVALKKYPKNILNPEQAKELILNLQKYSEIPLFISVDAEGGKVNRLKPEYGFSPILSAEKIGEDKTFNLAKTESEKLAKELNDAGFNMNFAPVVDLNINSKNPIIGSLGRSFSENAQTVLANAKIFTQSLTSSNVIPVAKHFPGHGSSATDSHIGLADVSKTYKEEELLPYKMLNEQGYLSAVMAGHIFNKNIDTNYPASLSKNFLQNILRKEIGFDGVIISDDMQMGAISENYGLKEAVVLAVNAGCNILVFSNNTADKNDKDIAYKAVDIIFQAIKNGEISQEKIDQSYQKIMELKAKFGII